MNSEVKNHIYEIYQESLKSPIDYNNFDKVISEICTLLDSYILIDKKALERSIVIEENKLWDDQYYKYSVRLEGVTYAPKSDEEIVGEKALHEYKTSELLRKLEAIK